MRIPSSLRDFLTSRNVVLGKLAAFLPVLIVTMASIPVAHRLFSPPISQVFFYATLIAYSVVGLIIAFLGMMALNFTFNRLGSAYDKRRAARSGAVERR